ncbi:MAG: hypothetical protein LBR60_05625 [Fibrobacter sp.]|jgi:hypothetical protein|nr:hypothetical protein [Fibrobacter sp.]
MSKTNTILVDFENVQPSDMGLLLSSEFENGKLFIFVGKNQQKIPLDTVKVVQKLGDRAEYIPIRDSGKNALDFHIIYYIGRLSEKEPGTSFYIISQDTGYDPLIKTLKEKEVSCLRKTCIKDIPLFKSKEKVELLNFGSKIELVKRRLSGKNKPNTLSALFNTIKNILKENKEADVNKVLESLIKNGFLSINSKAMVEYGDDK